MCVCVCVCVRVSVCDCEELQTLTCLPRAGNVHHQIGPA